LTLLRELSRGSMMIVTHQVEKSRRWRIMCRREGGRVVGHGAASDVMQQADFAALRIGAILAQVDAGAVAGGHGGGVVNRTDSVPAAEEPHGISARNVAGHDRFDRA
jgi:hypothetical protein